MNYTPSIDLAVRSALARIAQPCAVPCGVKVGFVIHGFSVLFLYDHQVAGTFPIWSSYNFEALEVFANGLQIALRPVCAHHVGVLEVDSDILVQILYPVCEGYTSGEEEP